LETYVGNGRHISPETFFENDHMETEETRRRSYLSVRRRPPRYNRPKRLKTQDSENMKRRDHLTDLAADGRINLH
jgi:hypothetical protein